MEYLLQSFANYGFPMVVASFLLLRMEKQLASLNDSVKDLVQILQIKQKYVEGIHLKSQIIV